MISLRELSSRCWSVESDLSEIELWNQRMGWLPIMPGYQVPFDLKEGANESVQFIQKLSSLSVRQTVLGRSKVKKEWILPRDQSTWFQDAVRVAGHYSEHLPRSCLTYFGSKAMASLTAKVEHEDSKPIYEDRHQEFFRFENALSGALRIFRPSAPQLIPLFVCLALIPIIIFLSLFSGWYVWKNVAVGWESPLYLQYG